MYDRVFLLIPGRVPSLPVKEKEEDMKILRVFLMIKKMIALNKKAINTENLPDTGYSGVKHPAEFLVR
jgi:hypothetical protein